MASRCSGAKRLPPAMSSSPPGAVPQHGRRRAVGEERVRDDQAEVVAHLERGAADFHRDAERDAARRRPLQGFCELQVGHRAAAAAADEVVRADVARQAQSLDQVGRDAGAEVSGAGVDHQARNVRRPQADLAQRVASGLLREINRPAREPGDAPVRVFVNETGRILEREMPPPNARMGEDLSQDRAAPRSQPRAEMLFQERPGVLLIHGERRHGRRDRRDPHGGLPLDATSAPISFVIVILIRIVMGVHPSETENGDYDYD